MQIVSNIFYSTRKLRFINLYMSVSPSLRQLPEVIDINIGITQITHSVCHQCIRSLQYQFFREMLPESIPAVPPHRRRQQQIVTDMNLEFLRTGSLRILSFESDHIFTFRSDCSCDNSCFRIQFQAFRQLLSTPFYRSLAGSRNIKHERSCRIIGYHPGRMNARCSFKKILIDVCLRFISGKQRYVYYKKSKNR